MSESRTQVARTSDDGREDLLCFFIELYKRGYLDILFDQRKLVLPLDRADDYIPGCTVVACVHPNLMCYLNVENDCFRSANKNVDVTIRTMIDL